MRLSDACVCSVTLVKRIGPSSGQSNSLENVQICTPTLSCLVSLLVVYVFYIFLLVTDLGHSCAPKGILSQRTISGYIVTTFKSIICSEQQ